MNQERFIKMLNLYIDCELVGAEIQEIEEAIASSPERQKIYAQYCRIERAAQQFLVKTEAPPPKIAALVAAARSAAGHEIPFPAAARPRPRWFAWGGAVSGLAAAGVALVIYFGGSHQAPRSPDLGTAPAMAASVPDVPAAERAPYLTVFTLDESAAQERIPGILAAEDPFEWMAQLEFEPIQRVRLDSWEYQEMTPRPLREAKAYHTLYPGPDDSMPREARAAFQFQR